MQNLKVEERPEGFQGLRNGTLTFIQDGESIYGITCAHVLDWLEKDTARAISKLDGLADEHPEIREAARRHFFAPKDDASVHINSTFYPAHNDPFTNDKMDIAIARIHPSVPHRIGKTPIDVSRLCDSYTRQDIGRCAIACGYPEQSRMITKQSEYLDKLGLAAVTAHAPFDGCSDIALRMFSELDHAPNTDNLSGMSGGPILWSNEDDWGLAGIVSDGKDLLPVGESNSNSFLDRPTIFITGQRLNREVFDSLVSNIPADDAFGKVLDIQLLAPRQVL